MTREAPRPPPRKSRFRRRAIFRSISWSCPIERPPGQEWPVIEELAADIKRRGTLLQSLNVRPILGDDGKETGMFEVPAGGRRFRAIQLLIEQKEFAKNGPVPCVVRDPNTPILAEDDSLAKNVQRAPLHALDQYRAFQAMRDKGMSEEEIAAAFFVTGHVVK